MPLSRTSSASSTEYDDTSLILDYAEKEAKQLVESAIAEAVSSEGDSVEPKKPEEKNFLVSLYSLQEKLTLRSMMMLLGLYVLLLTVQVIFQLDDRLFRRPAAPPRPFFREAAGEVLTDYYSGNGASPRILMRQAEIAIVLYYAPWSLESKQARPAFEQVARSFAKEPQFSFSAVNCFTAKGQCRISYKAHMFPILVAYVGRTALMYTGEYTADFVYRWISRLRQPMTRLHDREDVARFLSQHDYAVIAYFSMDHLRKRGASRFNQYLISSISFAQYDQLLDHVAFAVVTNPVTGLYMRFGYESQVRLYHWHRGVDYSHERNYTGAAIAEWVKEQSNDQQMVRWILPDLSNLGKTEQLHYILKGAPTVLLFTDREPLYEGKSDQSIVSQTALEYYACDENLVASFHNRAVKLEELRRQRTQMIMQDRQSCTKLGPMFSKMHECCYSTRRELDWLCHMCHTVDWKASNTSRTCLPYNPFRRQSRFFKTDFAACRRVYSYMSPETVLSECCAIMPLKGKRWHYSESDTTGCERYKLSQKMNYWPLSDAAVDKSYPFDGDSVFGLSCGRNSTLRFAAVDIRHYDYWIKRLSLPPVKKSLVVLVNAKSENIYLMREPFSRNALRDFVRQFHANSLEQHQISEPFLPPSAEENYSSVNDVLVRRTTAARFEGDILNPDPSKDIVLFFSGGGWHGPSTSVFYVYHTVAHYFKRFFGAVQFFMIDVSKNDLPWPYKMEKLPAILFFPAKRKSGSASFPTSVPLTVTNLIAFIVAHCQTELRWRIALSSCSQVCVHRNKLRLHRHAAILSNDIVALQVLAETYAPTRYTSLVGALISRRHAQLRVTRKLLALLRSLNALSGQQIRDEAAAMIQRSISLQSLFEYPLLPDITVGES